MNKIFPVSLICVLFSICLLCGCTEPPENTVNIYEIVELKSHTIETPGHIPGIYHEVRGEIKNIAENDIDKISIYVNFKDINNETLLVKSYTIHQFIENMTGNFVVEYLSSDSDYDKYDHYEIFIELDEQIYLLYY
jgi:hypothetical protein